MTNWKQLPKEQKAAEAFSVECAAMQNVYGVRHDPKQVKQRHRNADVTIYELDRVRDVNKIVADYYGTKPSLLQSTTKKADIVIMRGISIWFCYRMLLLRHYAMAEFYNSTYHHKSLYMTTLIDNLKEVNYPDTRSGIFVKRDMKAITTLIEKYIADNIKNLD